MSTIKTSTEDPHALVELWYPSDVEPQTVTVTLYHVRAADDVEIRFDLARNGWVIAMDKTRRVPGGCEPVEDKAEVAFVSAWNDVDEGDPDQSITRTRAAAELSVLLWLAAPITEGLRDALVELEAFVERNMPSSYAHQDELVAQVRAALAAADKPSGLNGGGA